MTDPPASSGRSALAVDELVDRLALEPHPEGGWFRRTWAHPVEHEGRSLATSIHYLLPEGVSSAWHRVDADELWLHHEGAVLDLSVVGPSDEVTVVALGPPSQGGASLQHTVPAGTWQSASSGAFTLVSCVVVPGFVWHGFELAPEGWVTGGAD